MAKAGARAHSRELREGELPLSSGPVPLSGLIKFKTSNNRGAKNYKSLDFDDLEDGLELNIREDNANARAFLGELAHRPPSDLSGSKSYSCNHSTELSSTSQQQSDDTSAEQSLDPDVEEMTKVFGEQLPPFIFLNSLFGSTHGEVRFVQHPNRDVSAHQWDKTKFLWVNIGQWSAKRKRIEGQLATARLRGQTISSSVPSNTLAYFRAVARQREKMSMAEAGMTGREGVASSYTARSYHPATTRLLQASVGSLEYPTARITTREPPLPSYKPALQLNTARSELPRFGSFSDVSSNPNSSAGPSALEDSTYYSNLTRETSIVPSTPVTADLKMAESFNLRPSGKEFNLSAVEEAHYAPHTPRQTANLRGGGDHDTGGGRLDRAGTVENSRPTVMSHDSYVDVESSLRSSLMLHKDSTPLGFPAAENDPFDTGANGFFERGRPAPSETVRTNGGPVDQNLTTDESPENTTRPDFSSLYTELSVQIEGPRKPIDYLMIAVMARLAENATAPRDSLSPWG